jgi:predicted lipoprotein
MKYIVLILSLLVLASCGKWDTSPDSTETVATTSDAQSQNPYYNELRKRCNELTEDKKEWCNASVTTMEANNYTEAAYDMEGNTLPCPEGMKQNTIRSYGALTWCE